MTDTSTRLPSPIGDPKWRPAAPAGQKKEKGATSFSD